jgi:maltooligosyltrehalose trehalohydrolase
MAQEVDKLSVAVGRPLTLIAESDLNDPRMVTPRVAGGMGLTAQWSDDFHHTIHTALTGEVDGYYEDYGQLDQLVTVLTDGWLFSGRWSDHRGRTHGRPLGGLPGWHLLGFLQNHDQVGNRAIGDRISDTVGVGRCKVGAALYLLGPFVPMVFQGEEWGASAPFQYFTSHTDVELGRAVAEGRRSEFKAFGWQPDQVPDPQDPATFERSALDWGELGRGDHAELLAWYRACIALRRSTPALIDGRLDQVRARCDAATGCVVVERGEVTIAVNLGTSRLELPVEGRPDRVLLASDESATTSGGVVSLPPDSVVVLGR